MMITWEIWPGDEEDETADEVKDEVEVEDDVDETDEEDWDEEDDVTGGKVVEDVAAEVCEVGTLWVPVEVVVVRVLPVAPWRSKM